MHRAIKNYPDRELAFFADNDLRDLRCQQFPQLFDSVLALFSGSTATRIVPDA